MRPQGTPFDETGGLYSSVERACKQKSKKDIALRISSSKITKQTVLLHILIRISELACAFPFHHFERLGQRCQIILLCLANHVDFRFSCHLKFKSRHNGADALYTCSSRPS